ncbi:hypothetical protein BGX21_010640 [Mortierella sp. AD011]|nr:hypothetical protein BGX21_010640 [Mortierella sp. AD011]
MTTERVGNPALDDSIATADHEHRKLLYKLRSHGEARESYSNANKWRYIHVASYQAYNLLPSNMNNYYRPSVSGLKFPGHILDKDVTPSFDKCTLPKIGKRIYSTSQLIYCLRLLNSSPASKERFNEAERDMTQATTKDPNEQIRLQEMAADLVQAFIETTSRVKMLLMKSITLICGGYDECQQTTNLYKSKLLNQPGDGSSKWLLAVVHSMDYKDQFQPIDQNNCRVSNLFQEAAIMPFNKDQIQGYIDQYVSMSKSSSTSWSATDYKKSLEDIPNLQELLTNPFIVENSDGSTTATCRSRKGFSSAEDYSHYSVR